VPERSFLALLCEAGFREAEVLARSRNARTTRPELIVADIRALK
jgi:hypothetical protein